MLTRQELGPEFRRALLEVIESGEDLHRVRKVLDQQLDIGVSREELIEKLTEIMLELRAEGRETEEDHVADTIDILTGW